MGCANLCKPHTVRATSLFALIHAFAIAMHAWNTMLHSCGVERLCAKRRMGHVAVTFARAHMCAQTCACVHSCMQA
eukprot:14081776-Alexandrium_andersonii.AAC.1